MMKRIAITQRVEIVPKYGERRDCLDQRWPQLVCALGHVPLPLPNIAPERVAGLLDMLQPDAVVFSGGNSIACLEPSAPGAAPERDAFEAELLQEALCRDIPVLGICRGMQAINVFLGGSLTGVDGHVGRAHEIYAVEDGLGFPDRVNSYHNWGIAREGLARGLEPLAFDRDGNVEAFRDPDKALAGIMWHPERETPVNPLDFRFLKRFAS